MTEPTMPLREALARALYEANRVHLMTVFRVPAASARWEYEDEKGRIPFYEQADAALAVIASRQPTRADFEQAITSLIVIAEDNVRAWELTRNPNASIAYGEMAMAKAKELAAARRAVLDLHQRRVDQAKAEVLGELREWVSDTDPAPNEGTFINIPDLLDQIDALLNQKGGE